MIKMFSNTLFILGYILLVGPPRAIAIRENADRYNDELQGKPVRVVMLFEFMLRAGIFLVIAASIESLLGDYLFERYQIDFFLLSLIIAGVIHTLTYYFGYCYLESQNPSVYRIYRLGRNFAYAIVPAFVAAGLVLIWQDFNHIELFSDDWVENTFIVTWSLFILMGLMEALLMKRIPTGLGKILSSRLQQSR